MIFHFNDKVMIRIAGAVLQFGDIAVIKNIDYNRCLDHYYCFCSLRNEGEWMSEKYFDKYREKPNQVDAAKVKFYATNKTESVIEAPTKKGERPPATYTNLPSPMGVYDELKSGKEIE